MSKHSFKLTSIKSLFHVYFFILEIQNRNSYPGGEYKGLYKEWEWTFDKIENDKCGHMLNDPQGSYYSKDPFVDTYMMCINMKLPTTYSVTFELNTFLNRQEVNWNRPIFRQEDPPKKGLWMAYTSTCPGDSGSPQMLFVVKKKDPKYVLAAIHSRAAGDFYNATTMNFYRAPCGTHTENTEQSPNHPNDEDTLRTIGITHKITYVPIFQWIKSKVKTT